MCLIVTSINPQSLSQRFWITLYIHKWGLFSFEGPIGRDIRTTVRMRWSFAQTCCAMSLVCPSIATHRTCDFWARSEPVNMPKTIVSRQMWNAWCNLIPLIRTSDKDAVLRYCPSSWQCSGAHCSCDKEAPEAFSMGSVWSPTIIRPDLAPCDFNLFPCMKRS